MMNYKEGAAEIFSREKTCEKDSSKKMYWNGGRSDLPADCSMISQVTVGPSRPTMCCRGGGTLHRESCICTCTAPSPATNPCICTCTCTCTCTCHQHRPFHMPPTPSPVTNTFTCHQHLHLSPKPRMRPSTMPP